MYISSCSQLNSVGAVGIATFQLCESIAQARDIQSIDGECSHATLHAPRTADQPFTGAPRCIIQGSVDDLN